MEIFINVWLVSILIYLICIKIYEYRFCKYIENGIVMGWGDIVLGLIPMLNTFLVPIYIIQVFLPKEKFIKNIIDGSKEIGEEIKIKGEYRK